MTELELLEYELQASGTIYVEQYIRKNMWVKTEQSKTFFHKIKQHPPFGKEVVVYLKMNKEGKESRYYNEDQFDKPRLDIGIYCCKDGWSLKSNRRDYFTVEYWCEIPELNID